MPRTPARRGHLNFTVSHSERAVELLAGSRRGWSVPASLTPRSTAPSWVSHAHRTAGSALSASLGSPTHAETLEARARPAARRHSTSAIVIGDYRHHGIGMRKPDLSDPPHHLGDQQRRRQPVPSQLRLEAGGACSERCTTASPRRSSRGAKETRQCHDGTAAKMVPLNEPSTDIHPAARDRAWARPR